MFENRRRLDQSGLTVTKRADPITVVAAVGSQQSEIPSVDSSSGIFFSV